MCVLRVELRTECACAYNMGGMAPAILLYVQYCTRVHGARARDSFALLYPHPLLTDHENIRNIFTIFLY